jgi:3-methyladenine DNA glycosylase AlkC
MAGKLKDFFDAEIVRSIARDLHRAYPSLGERRFVDDGIDGLDRLELTARAWHIADVMHEHLPSPFGEAAKVLIASLGPELASTETFGFSPLRYMPHVFFVQRYGLADFEPAMRAQYELTKRFSAESSIRAFLVDHPERTYARLVDWAEDPNPHVRRLVSEGTRPRLPWAPRLRAFQENPAPVLDLLERLKDDPVRYVQRSVANNLNDIGKDHPDLVVETCRRWAERAPAGRRWIIEHATRSLVKQGHREVLDVLGFGGRPKVHILDVRITPREVRIGKELRFLSAPVLGAPTFTKITEHQPPC